MLRTTGRQHRTPSAVGVVMAMTGSWLNACLACSGSVGMDVARRRRSRASACDSGGEKAAQADAWHSRCRKMVGRLTPSSAAIWATV